MLENSTIILKPISYSDTDNIILWRNQPFVREHFIYQKLFTKETHENWLQTMVDTGKVQQFIIILKSNNEPIGSVYLRDIDNINKKAEYGIFIGVKDYLGKGIGHEVASIIIDYAFNTLNLHKIFLRVFADNTCAIASYKKSGFVEEGCFKDDVKIENNYYDIVFMSVINPNS